MMIPNQFIYKQLRYSTTEWLYGSQLHLICIGRGHLLNFSQTPGNVDDRQPLYGEKIILINCGLKEHILINRCLFQYMVLHFM